MPTWPETRNAIHAAMVAASALAADRVIWRYGNADAPALSYVGLSFSGLEAVGQDGLVNTLTPSWLALTVYAAGDRVLNDGGKTYLCTTGGTSAGVGGPTGAGGAIVDGTCVWQFRAVGEELRRDVTGFREATLHVEAFTSSTSGAGDALILAETIRTSLRLPSIRGLLSAVGVTPFDPSDGIQFAPDIVAVGFRGRALLDVRCWLPAPVVFELAGYITSIEGTVTALQPDAPAVVVPFVVA